MKHLSRWARQNPIRARFLIALCHLLITANAIWLGTQLFALDWGESSWLLPIAEHLFFVPFLCYPLREKTNTPPHRAYLRRRTLLSFPFAILYIIVIATWANNALIQAPPRDQFPVESVGIFIAIQPNQFRTDPVTKPIIVDLRKNIMAINKWIKQEISDMKQLLKPNEKKKKVTAGKVFLILFTLLVGFFLFVFMIGHLAVASLNTTSSVPEIVALLGLAFLILMIVLVVKKIVNRKEPKIETN